MKPGYKTTEFYLAVLSSVVTLLNQSGIIGNPLPADAIMTIGGVIAAYIASRTVVKK
jgi:hypothetical protein